MMGYAYFAAGVFSESTEDDPTVTEASCLSKGSHLLRRAYCVDEIWHEKIISCSLRVALVENIAKRYVNRGMALLDLIREGNLGLTHALKNFETEGGSRFSSYATRCIRQHIERAIGSRSGAAPAYVAAKVTQSPAIADPHLHCRSV